MALTKVAETLLYALKSIAAATIDLGTGIDVSTYYGADVRIRMGRGTATAFTVSPEIRIEGSHRTAPSAFDETDWVTLATFAPLVGANIGSQAVSGTANANDTTLLLAAGTNFAAGDYLFIQNGTIANSEWKRTNGLATATFTLQEGLLNAQTGSTVRNQAEMYHAQLDLTAINRLRIVVNNQAGGQAMIVEAGLGATTAL